MRLVSDDELILMIRLKNEEAILMILTKYESFMRNWAIKSIRTQKARQVELADMVQIGKQELWEILHQYRNEEGNFFSFLKLCVERTFYLYIRTFLANLVPNYSEYSLDEPVNESSNYSYLDFCESPYFISFPSRVYELQEDIHHIYSSSLSPLEKQALSLKMLGDSYDEIASKLNISRKRVDNLIARIKTKIKVNR